MDHDRRLTAIRPDLADERLRGQVDAPRFAPGLPRRVRAASAPVRRHPDPAAPLDTEALGGETVRVFEEAAGFAWVQLDRDGYVGYLPADALGAPGPAPTHRVVAPRTFLYPRPDLKAPPTGLLSMGALVAAGEPDGEYRPVSDGGFVHGRHLAPVGEPLADFVAAAEMLAGTPYLWGGKTSLGIDCSGLVQVAMAIAGLDAPRDSDMQAAALGTPLPFGDDRPALRRGDLVHWRGHVGIMRDATILLHANGHHMMVFSEPLREAEKRIAAAGSGPVTAIRRPDRLGADG